MSKRNWTESQRWAISARNGSLLVSAAAGSGKTAVLVQRVIERLTDPERPCDADRLLIVTFTNAAAAEMKERISAAIGELLQADPANAQLQRQQILLNRAHISTIHSFCNELVRENFCDGFGDCLPGCPTGAITFEEREAPAYDEAAVQENKKKKELQEKMKHLHEGGCPGSRMWMLEQPEAAESAVAAPVQPVSRLRNWPVQIKLAPIHAPYFEGAKLLIAADCTAYAYANFHQEFMRGKVTLIGCPKLDAVDYSEKLTEILRSNDIQSVTILRMEVPCCGGLEMAAKKALQTSGKFIPWQVVTISIDGKILD